MRNKMDLSIFFPFMNWIRCHWNRNCRLQGRSLQGRSLRRSCLSALLVAHWPHFATFRVRCFVCWFVSRFLFWCSSRSSKVLRSRLRRIVRGVLMLGTTVSNSWDTDWFCSLCNKCMTSEWEDSRLMIPFLSLLITSSIFLLMAP